MLTEKSIYLPNDLRNFNEIFRKDGAYDNIKSHKKTGLHLSLEDKFLEKPKGGGGIKLDHPFSPSLLRVK